MEMKPVKSSTISHVGHDPLTNTLHVQFHPGKTQLHGPVYSYADVPAAMHAALIGAESVGKHFAAHIKGNPKHPHTLHKPATKKE